MYPTFQLINAPMEQLYVKSSRTGNYPPLSLAALAGYILNKHPDYPIELIDGEFTSLDKILNNLSAQVIGISCNVMTYKNALIITKAASQNGSKVILGGPYPSSMAQKILSKRSYIDAAVVGDGEMALLNYLEGRSNETIPNLVYRKDGSIQTNKNVDFDLNKAPNPNYANLNLALYFKNFSERYNSFKPFKKSLAIYSRKGCIWREQSNGGCVFCMIPHQGIRYRNKRDIWNEIISYQNIGIDYVWDVCDTFTEDDRWIKEFIGLRPSNCNVRFQIYGRPNHITNRMSMQLRELGVYEVFIGAESGDDVILKNSNKGITVTQVRRAVDALANCGLKVIISFVLGLPGENYETLQKTIDFARELISYGNSIETSCSIMLPIPGSAAFSQLVRIPQLKDKYAQDLFDLEEIKVDWVKFFTDIPYAELLAAQDEITELFPLNSSFSKPEWISAPCC
ncbi:MAG: B12-binding domain-containing radical SAM protein [candidate division KSB1 bacterium]|nr:B12-binding domain-containing radical SAM protein [candidate division KSB1 bacterium]MDZ7367143.1 B12-binding domain-containing radical SAM protein [candidate division KSB1 bacterium]MDZ7405121.1 B12-binding domain-containing radical SAM protein [candidate division KSB1 bacterium]